MSPRIKNFILIVAVVLLASACGSSSKRNPDSLPTDTTTVFNDSTAAA